MLIARSRDAWQVLLQHGAPPGSNNADLAPWTLPGAPYNPTQDPQSVLAKYLHRDAGQRIVTTELLPLGWFHTSAVGGQERHISAYGAILPSTDSEGPVHESMRWWSLRAAVADNTAPTVLPIAWQVLRDAAILAPTDDVLSPIVCTAEARHESSLLSLLHSVRERTGGSTPAVWDQDLSNLDRSHRNNGGEFLVAALQDFVVGMAGIRRISGSTAEMTWVMVHPRWRYLGLGTTLIREAERHATQLGFTTIGVTNHQLHGSGRRAFHKAGYDVPERGSPAAMLGLSAVKSLVVRSAAPGAALSSP